MTDALLPNVPGVAHHYVEVDGVRLHYAEAGSGDPLVLLHGWPQHWWMWRHVVPLLAPHARLVMIDLRGFGWSDAPAAYELYDRREALKIVLEP